MYSQVDVDQSRELTSASGVKSMPTIQFFRNGKKVHEIVGGDKAALRAEVLKALQPAILRVLASEKLLVVAAASYLLFPWQRVLRYA